MVLFVKVPDLFEAFTELEINLATDSIRIALSNIAPAAETLNPLVSNQGILANVTQIAYTNYSDDLVVDRVLEGVTSNEAAGIYTFDANNVVISAVGGALATFRYIYVYDFTATTPANPLLCLIDNELGITLASGESVTIAWNALGIFTIA